MGRNRQAYRVRTDRTATEVLTNANFGGLRWGTALDVRGYSRLGVFINIPTLIGAPSYLDVFVAFSDDGTTIGFDDDDNFLRSDYTLTNFSDGTFNPRPYTARFTVADGSLVADMHQHLIVPVKAGYCRVGMFSDGGSFGGTDISVQRLVV